MCVPSQNGLVTDPPQRHRKTFFSPVRSMGWPVLSISYNSDRSPETAMGPLGVKSILTVMSASPGELC